MSENADVWKRCGSCKKPIAWGARYWICGVSSCNRGRFQLAFCSLGCWDAHVPAMNHRSAWAEEATAPPRPGAEPAVQTRTLGPAKPAPAVQTRVLGPPGARPSAPQPQRPAVAPPVREEGPQRRIVRPAEPEPAAGDDEVLIVASRLKQYIRERSDMNTSADVLALLSDMVRRACDDAIEQAREDGRKTVMARDFK